jgi:alpha-L-fucosidase 2
VSKKSGRRLFIKKAAVFSAGTFFLPASFEKIKCQDSEFLTPPDLPAYPQDLLNVDWEPMMKDHDLIWHIMPKEMTEAPHFGNGLIGSMIWAQDNSLHLQVFRSDVHDHNDFHYGWSAYSRPRYQIGYFLMKLKGEITGCDLRQDIYNAELKGKIFTTSGIVSIHHFTHRHDDVLYTKIEMSGNEELHGWEWHPFKAKTSRGGDAAQKTYGQQYSPYKTYTNPEHRVEQHHGIYAGIQDLFAGGDFTTAWKETLETSQSTLLVSIGNSYPEKKSAAYAIKQIQQAAKIIEKDFSMWVEKHYSWWHNYYRESFVTFPDNIGQTFYWNNIYRLACCTRPDAQYIDTPGLWNSGGTWPYSTHDFNTQIAHLPVYTANRLHLSEALMHSLYRHQKNLIDNVVPEEWQSDSALLPLATAFDLKGKRNDDGRYSEMVGCLPWLLHNCWLHYRYSMDVGLLRNTIFPLLRRSINMYRHMLFTGPDGKLHLPPTFSPETGNANDCNFDLALLKWGCVRLIEICGILKTEDPLLPEWSHILQQLTAYPVDERGYKIGSDKTAPVDHQHMSHLLMIYPLCLENIDNNQHADVIKNSVKNFQPVTMPKMGASQSSPAAAALGLGNLAYQRMNDILFRETKNEKLGRNGIYYLATPCIETSLSYNTCVQDMLLQSWGDKIRIFPALPDEWQDVAFHNFRTEGAFLISASRKKGVTEFVRIKSLAGTTCKISPSINGVARVVSKNNNTVTDLGGGCYGLDLKKGEEAILYPANQKMDKIVIAPLPVNKESINYFGIK